MIDIEIGRAMGEAVPELGKWAEQAPDRASESAELDRALP